ncbi:RNA polymerase sigma factor [Mumia quercus]|uniref:RNA polymerase sigma factor n=1 Tax=Mumia quercus TaxID=2976125 RepID=UPI0021CE2D41|nr:sigma-70 family RNA polymerase sigma factor [Mumia quercus]
MGLRSASGVRGRRLNTGTKLIDLDWARDVPAYRSRAEAVRFVRPVSPERAGSAPENLDSVVTQFAVPGQEQGMEPPSSPSQLAREQRFRGAYDAVYLDPSHAEDITADVMLVAWRRLDDLSAELPDARAWLFGVARHTIQNARRGSVRRAALAVRLAEASTSDGDAENHSKLVAQRVDIASAWTRLSASHQEAIALTVFDGLTASEAATVLGISSAAYRLRLSRARRTLRDHTSSHGPDLAQDAVFGSACMTSGHAALRARPMPESRHSAAKRPRRTTAGLARRNALSCR